MNIDKCAFIDTGVDMNEFKFGDRLLSRNGEMAICLGKSVHKNNSVYGHEFVEAEYYHTAHQSGSSYKYQCHYQNGTTCFRQWDIVGKWENTQPTTGEAVSDGGF